MSRPLRGIFVILILLLSLLIINLLQCVSLLLLPFSRHLVRIINRFFASIWWSLCVICTEKICGINIVFSGDTLPKNEQAILIVNHQKMADIIILLSLAYRNKRIGDLKWFVKNPLKYVPGIGWGMLFLDCIFLKREWAKDQKSVFSTFEKFRKNKIPFWLVSFLEGTRATPEKIVQSQIYAQKNKLPILQNVLIPRTKGFTATIQGLERVAEAIYDITIGFENKAPSLFAFFLKKEVNTVHVYCNRSPIQNLPKENKQIGEWVINRFVEKDKLLQNFKQKGNFST